MATQQHGSRRKRDATSSLVGLAEAHASNQFIASLDLSQAFDRIRPARAVACLIHYGFPLKLAKAVEKLWQNQQRFLGWSSECRPQAATVSSSIPQGDSLSPWVLNILLAAPTKIIAGMFPSATQVVYVDDRSFACPTVNMLRDLWAQWRNHSVQLGLKENRSKTQVYARTAKARRQLETDPDFAEFAKDQLTALGVCFCPGNTKPSDKQKARFDSAEVTALRARCAPVVAYLRQFMATTAATAKAVFGWIVRGPPRYLTTPLEAHLRKVGFAHVAGSVHLIKLIFGHGLDVSFMAGQSAVTAVFRFCQVAQRNLLDWNKKGGLSCRVRQFLRSLGFQERGQFFWQHRSLPTTIDLTFLGVNAGDSNELCHHLRLAWRWLMWTSMQKQERLDTARVRNVPFDAERIQRIRSLCSSPQTAHVPAIACGAFVSPMRFAKITRVGTGICPFCEKAPGTADHVFWRCPVTNPNQILPCDDLEAVFGWPDRDNADCLHHMAHVRKLTLALRYPRGGGGGGLRVGARLFGSLAVASPACDAQQLWALAVVYSTTAKRLLVLKSLLAVQACQCDSKLIYMWSWNFLHLCIGDAGTNIEPTLWMYGVAWVIWHSNPMYVSGGHVFPSSSVFKRRPYLLLNRIDKMIQQINIVITK